MDFILDASFALHWCFEDETTEAAEAVLTRLEDQRSTAWAPSIWSYELMNGLGKGIARGRLQRKKGLLLWKEICSLPIRLTEVAVNEDLLELALLHNLAVYDASYLSLALTRRLPLATGDVKLQVATQNVGLEVIQP